MENYAAIAAEAEAAIRSVADVSQPNGYPATIRKAGAGQPQNPYDPPGGTPTDHTVHVVVFDDELRDLTGTLIGQTKRTVLVSGAAGVVPSDDDTIALGVTAEQVTDATVWAEIISVLEVSPAGVAVLYELTLG